MKKKETIACRIQEVRFPNKGRAEYEGVPVWIKNTLPGQLVEATLQKKKSGGWEARLLSVLEKAPDEISPGCSHFDFCGGCSYQNITHKAELAIKEAQVLQLLKAAGITDFAYEGITPAPSPTGYRNKCEFSFGDSEKDGPLALGFRRRQSFYEVVTLTDCTLVDTDYLSIVSETLAFFTEHGTPFYHKKRHDGVLRHLVVRKGAATGEILVNLVTTSHPGFSLNAFSERLLALDLDGTICGILHTANDSLADVVKPESVTLLYGRDFFMEKLFDLSFRVSAFSFFQTNSKGAEALYGIVRDFAGNTQQKVIFDLYCGTGTIGQILAKDAKKVIGIELVEEAVIAARENAIRNGLTNCTFLAGDVLQKVDELEEKPDLLILDPPRDGIHPKAIQKLIAFDAPEIIYVSCKPTSLARDLPIFQAAGYQVERIRLMDMFPRTNHVETIVLLQRADT